MSPAVSAQRRKQIVTKRLVVADCGCECLTCGKTPEYMGDYERMLRWARNHAALGHETIVGAQTVTEFHPEKPVPRTKRGGVEIIRE